MVSESGPMASNEGRNRIDPASNWKFPSDALEGSGWWFPTKLHGNRIVPEH